MIWLDAAEIERRRTAAAPRIWTLRAVPGNGVAVFVGYIGPSAAGLIVGYIGPSAAGLIAAWLISTGRMYAVLWLGLALVAVMLLAVRNFLARSP